MTPNEILQTTIPSTEAPPPLSPVVEALLVFDALSDPNVTRGLPGVESATSVAQDILNAQITLSMRDTSRHPTEQAAPLPPQLVETSVRAEEDPAIVRARTIAEFDRAEAVVAQGMGVRGQIISRLALRRLAIKTPDSLVRLEAQLVVREGFSLGSILAHAASRAVHRPVHALAVLPQAGAMITSAYLHRLR